jgi:hypothetical protein
MKESFEFSHEGGGTKLITLCLRMFRYVGRQHGDVE